MSVYGIIYEKDLAEWHMAQSVMLIVHGQDKGQGMQLWCSCSVLLLEISD